MAEDKVELIGDYLRKEREKLDISIKIIANDTKINITQLELLEDNQFEKLPNIAYIRGFVKNYAKTLNLPLDKCLDILEQSYYPNQEPVSHQFEQTKESEYGNHKSTKKPAKRLHKVPNINTDFFKRGPAIFLGFSFLTIASIILLINKPDDDGHTPIVKEIKPQTLNLKTKLLNPQVEHLDTVADHNASNDGPDIAPPPPT